MGKRDRDGNDRFHCTRICSLVKVLPLVPLFLTPSLPLSHMSSYSPLPSHEREYHDSEESLKHPLIVDKSSSDSEPRGRAAGSEPSSDWSRLGSFGLSILAIATSAFLLLASLDVPGPRDARGLLKKSPYPNLEMVDVVLNTGLGACTPHHQTERNFYVDGHWCAAPQMMFPGTIIRLNEALPDRVYNSGSRVTLSDTVGSFSSKIQCASIELINQSNPSQDSMIFQFRTSDPKFTSCYIDAFVPPPEEGLAANKTYTSSGSLTSIQVWNVTTPNPSRGIKSLSWNTRPKRIGLMGTVAFLPEKEKIEKFELEDGWELGAPTRFPCTNGTIYTIEVACKGCTLEFDQIFSDPPLGK